MRAAQLVQYDQMPLLDLYWTSTGRTRLRRWRLHVGQLLEARIWELARHDVIPDLVDESVLGDEHGDPSSLNSGGVGGRAVRDGDRVRRVADERELEAALAGKLAVGVAAVIRDTNNQHALRLVVGKKLIKPLALRGSSARRGARIKPE